MIRKIQLFLCLYASLKKVTVTNELIRAVYNKDFLRKADELSKKYEKPWCDIVRAGAKTGLHEVERQLKVERAAKRRLI